MGGLQGWQKEATRNASKPVRKTNMDFTDVELQYLNHVFTNDVVAQQQLVDEGGFGVDLSKSKLLLNRFQEALE